VARLRMFGHACAHRRCIVPVDGFFERMATKHQKATQPFAIVGKLEGSGKGRVDPYVRDSDGSSKRVGGDHSRPHAPHPAASRL
jgi:hypothetical protein